MAGMLGLDWLDKTDDELVAESDARLERMVADTIIDIKTGMRKVSFASRSEAGRYAANQRWKDHTKEDDSGGLDGSGDEGRQQAAQTAADHINESAKTVTAAGFALETFFGHVKDMPSAVRTKLHNDIAHTRLAMREGYRYDDLGGGKLSSGKNIPREIEDGFNIIDRAMETETALKSPSMVVLRDPRDGLIAGVMVVGKMGRTGEIMYLGSTGLVKGAGSVMFGEAMKYFDRYGITKIELSVLRQAVPFWEKIGFTRQGTSGYTMVLENYGVKDLVGLLNG